MVLKVKTSINLSINAQTPPTKLFILALTKMSNWSPKLCHSAVKQEKHFQAAPASGLRVKVNVRKKTTRNWKTCQLFVSEPGLPGNDKCHGPDPDSSSWKFDKTELYLESFYKLIQKNFSRHRLIPSAHIYNARIIGFNRKSSSWKLRKRSSSYLIFILWNSS